MDQVMWYYQEGQQPIGPIGTEELCAKFAAGELPLTTNVYCDEIKQWAPAQTIRGFREAVPPPAPQAPVAEESTAPANVSPATLPTALPPPVKDHVIASSGAWPWTRFFARGVDVLAFKAIETVLLAGLLGSFLAPLRDMLHEPGGQSIVMLGLAVAITIFGWTVFNALFVSLLGTTPGKWLLGLSLRSGTGSRLAFSQAFAREWNMIFFGLGLGFPPATLILLILAYLRLMDKGDTAWDRRGGVIVQHVPCGAARVTAAFGVALASLAIFIGSDTITALAAAHRPRFNTNAISFPTIQPQPITVMPIEMPKSADPRIGKISGTWICTTASRSGNERFTLRDVLVLNPDATFRQSLHVLDSKGKEHPELGHQWSGTWELNGDKLIQNVSLSTTNLYPVGQWGYELKDLRFDALNIQRTIEPDGFRYAGRKPLFKFQRMTATVKAE